MENPIDKLDSWQAMNLERMQKMLKEELPLKNFGRWVFTNDISPLDLYVYLKARFGLPNGFQMFLKNPSSDNFIHWHWTLQVDEDIIDFMGFNMYAEALMHDRQDFSIHEGHRFEEGIKQDFKNIGKRMSEVRKDLEKWHIFVNPYNRLRKVIDRFSNELNNLSIDKIEIPKLPHRQEELKGFEDKFKNCLDSYSKAMGLGTSLRMLAPVLAEAFVNLVIFLLAKPDIKQDSRMYNDVLRREIDVRVKSLHINCEGFNQAIPSDAQEFKDFHTLMNGRNDFLHGNIDPVKLKYEVMFFDKNTPIPKSYNDFSKLALVNSLIHVEPEVALRDVMIVDCFIKLVIDQMNDTTAEIVKRFMETSNPGWRDDTMKAGILFPPEMSHGVPGPTKTKQKDQGDQLGVSSKNKSKIVHQIKRLTIAADSFHQCLSLLKHIEAAKIRFEGDIYPPMMTGIVVTYSKNFNQADGLGPLPSKFTKFPEVALKTAHIKLIESRNKLYAHRDVDAHSFKNSDGGLSDFPVEVRINDENTAFLFQPYLYDIPLAKIPDIRNLIQFQMQRLQEDLDEKLALVVDFNKGYKQGDVYLLGEDFP